MQLGKQLVLVLAVVVQVFAGTVQAQRETLGNFIGVEIKADEIGLGIGSKMWKHIFEELPNQKIKDTKYNRQTAKNFKFKRINADARSITFEFRYRLIKFSNKPWPASGTFTVFDNAWDVTVAISHVIESRKIKAKATVLGANSDWPSGLAGMFMSAFDATAGSLFYLFTGDFFTVSDLISIFTVVMAQMGSALIEGGGGSAPGDLTRYVSFYQKLNDMNQGGALYAKAIDYEPTWIWFRFSADTGAAKEELRSILREHFPSFSF